MIQEPEIRARHRCRAEAAEEERVALVKLAAVAERECAEAVSEVEGAQRREAEEALSAIRVRMDRRREEALLRVAGQARAGLARRAEEALPQPPTFRP